ncbi:Uncharacterised protein [Streptococcus pneumoniae]|nr:Uncharacterised protein [Streptococcus pneumoniae]
MLYLTCLQAQKLPQQFWISVVVKDSILANYKKVTLKKLSMPLTSPKIQSNKENFQNRQQILEAFLRFVFIV